MKALALLSALTGVWTAGAEAYYASPNGTGDCLSSATPGSITAAFTLAAKADGNELVLLDGTYDFSTLTPGATGNDGYYLKTASAITIRSLSGRRGDVTLDGKKAAGARAFKFVSTGAAMVRDVTFTGFGTFAGPQNGGAIYGTAETVVSNCVFRRNYGKSYGGAVYKCRVVDSLFDHNDLGACLGTNRFGESGAATADTECHGCWFVDNCYTNYNATLGGSACYRGSFYDCTFSNNVIGAGASKLGGTCFRPTVVSNCVFVGNGGWAPLGGAVYGADNYGTVCYDSVFVGNRAASAGALYSCVAYRCAFTNNAATKGMGGAGQKLLAFDCDFYRNCSTNSSVNKCSGGGAHCVGSATRCTYRGNWAYGNTGGGGVAFGVAMTNCLVTGNRLEKTYDGSPRYVGGLLDNCHLVNCTVVSNAVTLKESCVLVGVNTSKDYGANWAGSSELVNSIFVGNVAVSDTALGSVTNSIVTTLGAKAVDLGGVQVVSTPAEAGLVAWMPTDPDCGYLKRKSIAIDKGGDVGFTAADVDLRYKRRINGEKVDLGCYEYWALGLTLIIR